MAHLMVCCLGMACAYSGASAILLFFLADYFGSSEQFAIALTATLTVVVQGIGPLVAAMGNRFASNFALQSWTYRVWFAGSLLCVCATLDAVVRLVGGTGDGAKRSAPVIAIATLGAFLAAMSFGVCNTLQVRRRAQLPALAQPSAALSRSLSATSFTARSSRSCDARSRSSTLSLTSAS